MEQKICPKCGLICEREQYICPCCLFNFVVVKAEKTKDIITERKIKKAPTKKRALTIGKRGTILLSKILLIDQLGFKQGDKFRVAKKRDSIILRKTE